MSLVGFLRGVFALPHPRSRETQHFNLHYSSRFCAVRGSCVSNADQRHDPYMVLHSVDYMARRGDAYPRNMRWRAHVRTLGPTKSSAETLANAFVSVLTCVLCCSIANNTALFCVWAHSLSANFGSVRDRHAFIQSAHATRMVSSRGPHNSTEHGSRVIVDETDGKSDNLTGQSFHRFGNIDGSGRHMKRRPRDDCLSRVVWLLVPCHVPGSNTPNTHVLTAKETKRRKPSNPHVRYAPLTEAGFMHI